MLLSITFHTKRRPPPPPLTKDSNNYNSSRGKRTNLPGSYLRTAEKSFLNGNTDACLTARTSRRTPQASRTVRIVELKADAQLTHLKQFHKIHTPEHPPPNPPPQSPPHTRQQQHKTPLTLVSAKTLPRSHRTLLEPVKKKMRIATASSSSSRKAARQRRRREAGSRDENKQKQEKPSIKLFTKHREGLNERSSFALNQQRCWHSQTNSTRHTFCYNLGTTTNRTRDFLKTTTKPMVGVL